ncbi:MAG: uridylate kinase [Parcubacteria group bacterium Gr01-1014_66]|nr:MAG: uridylate kinase [Parcubacteria group bacterium Gr01-1014_66]
MSAYPQIRWKRILLKLSGETLGGKGKSGLDIAAIRYIAGEIQEAYTQGCEMVVVLGGGNFIRGAELAEIGIDRATADYMGMLGTVMNALVLQNMLEQKTVQTRVMSTITMIQIAEPFIRRRAIRHLEKGRIVIFAGGTGNPYFTTDTAAALRASEVNAEVILKATDVEGVYDQDPNTNENAKLLREINPLEMVKKGLKVMDLTAVTLSMENKIPIVVFDVFTKGNLKRLILGEKIGTEVS